MAKADYELVMVHLVRDGALLEQAQMAQLAPEDFNKSKLRPYRYVWSAALSYYGAHHEPIPQSIMCIEIDKEMAGEEMITDRLLHRTQDLVKYIYSFGKEDLASDYVRDNMLQAMIDELKFAPRLQQMAAETSTDRLAEMFADNQHVYDQTRVVVNREADMFSEAGRRRHTEGTLPERTGIDFVDMSTGGLRPGSLIGVLAESSGGKTMFGTQFLCEQAMRKNLTLGFFYEQSLEGDIAERFYSYLSGTPRDDLSGKTHDEYPESTKRCLNTLQAKMQEHCRIYDMSGSVAGQGNGGPEELEAIIGRMHRKGDRPKTLVLDWLGPMVTKYYNLPKNMRTADKREKIDLVLTRFKEITERYGINIVVLHQIAAHIIEGKTPHYKPDWTVAAECKSFGFLMDYVFTFGRKCDKTNCMWFNSPKARGASKHHRIVRMDAQLNKILDAKEFIENPMADRDKTYFAQGKKKKGGMSSSGLL